MDTSTHSFGAKEHVHTKGAIFSPCGVRGHPCLDGLAKNGVRDIVDTSTHSFGVNEHVHTNEHGFLPCGGSIKGNLGLN